MQWLMISGSIPRPRKYEKTRRLSACLGGRENDFVGRAFRRGGSAKGTPPALRMRCTASGSDSFRTVVR